MRIEAELVRAVATAARDLSGATPTAARISARDERRVSRALRHIEAHADQALDLDQLAAVAAMSKFHFLRVFRGVIGLTPYHYLLSVRLRRVALHLQTSSQAISAIAYDAGFGDLSTFNATFRATFGMSPQAYRHRHPSHAR